MAISQKYQKYLNSPQWRNKRLRVLRRDDFKCRRCKKARAAQVHHLTYKRVGKERLSDLLSVCARCHRIIHGLEKEDKPQKISVFGIGKVLAKVIR